jgi:diamine N-acetyltransferase
MMNEITMRRITLRDVPALSVLAKQTFCDTFTGTCTEEDMQDFLERYYNENTLAKEVEDKSMEYFFAMIDEEIVGYLLFADGKEDFAEIHGSTALELKRFYVSKEFHGKGTAHKMMDFFLGHAKAQGYDTAFLGVWEFNHRAQKFYSKFDFKLTNHRHNFPIGKTPQTDVYMWKSLE